MKKFLIEMAWLVLAMISMSVWEGLFEWAHDLPTVLIAAVLGLAPFTGMVIGFRRGFPDGMWGIK